MCPDRRIAFGPKSSHGSSALGGGGPGAPYGGLRRRPRAADADGAANLGVEAGVDEGGQQVVQGGACGEGARV